MVEDYEFWELYNKFMASDLRPDQKQVFYFGAKMRYMGAKFDILPNGDLKRRKDISNGETSSNGNKKVLV